VEHVPKLAANPGQSRWPLNEEIHNFKVNDEINNENDDNYNNNNVHYNDDLVSCYLVNIYNTSSTIATITTLLLFYVER
jgi:hypothetical protein